MKKLSLFIFLISFGLLYSCNNKQPLEVDPEDYELKARVNIIPNYNGVPMEFNQNYTTQEGYTIEFTKLNFIMTNFENNGKRLFESAVYKFEENERLLWEGAGNYLDFSNFSANIGVDATQNHEDPSAREADDPLFILNTGDMHWGWNTGYIFIILEGKADTSATQDGTGIANFAYHIGRDQMLRSFNLQNLDWEKVTDNIFETNITIDLYNFFDGSTQDIDIKNERTSHTTPSQISLSEKIIDNFVEALSL
ncbi:MbnP family protein [Brumimicrobium mesophilum]|uniref:MbnP family protein n=1 Tax=Brumimicrobium mesophilum TaxID=392717 RepID=UPI000D143E06|nr:MbnP family protein [Brumimicrobium mesophilum]